MKGFVQRMQSDRRQIDEVSRRVELGATSSKCCSNALLGVVFDHEPTHGEGLRK